MAVNLSKLHPRLRHIAKNIPRAAAYIGVRARVTSGYRNPKLQAKLYADYQAGLSHYPVAPPGSSLHEKGLAIDVVSDNESDMVRLLTSVGLIWAGEGDPVHFALPVQSRAKSGLKTAFQSWAEGPGRSIPSVAGTLPLVGGLARTAKDPAAELAFRADQALNVVLGFL